jgi:hypothetical protein
MYNDNEERIKEITFSFFFICEPESTNVKEQKVYSSAVIP